MVARAFCTVYRVESFLHKKFISLESYLDFNFHLKLHFVFYYDLYFVLKTYYVFCFHQQAISFTRRQLLFRKIWVYLSLYKGKILLANMSQKVLSYSLKLLNNVNISQCVTIVTL